jgi:alcohol dehydrogenase class IV
MTAGATLPRVLRLGGGAARDLPEVLAFLGIARPLFVADPFFAGGPILGPLSGGAPVFSGVVPDPTTDSVECCIAEAREAGADGLVALGGGSAMDTAKAAALILRHGGRMADYAAPRRVLQSGLPVVAIPTTAGTGSEATGFCVITASDSGDKFVCQGPGMVPAAALVDYELTMSVPARLKAETGIDALVHGMEAFVGRAAHPWSDLQALEAVRLVGGTIRQACASREDRAAHETMARGSFLAGVAFSASGPGLIHAMSAPFGGAFDVPHALSVAMLMVPVTRFSLPAAPPRYASLSRVLGIAQGSDETAAAAWPDFLERLAVDLGVRTMSGFGISEARYRAEIPAMAVRAPRSGAAGNNPRQASLAEIEELFHAAWR